jgi:filamentous hemagglutinin
VRSARIVAPSRPYATPNHGDDGRFTFGPDGGTIDPVAYKPRGPTPPPPPKPPTPPPTPVAPAVKPNPTTPSPPKKLEDILKPGGNEVGGREGRAGPGIRTVSPSEFDQLERDLLAGAREVPAPSNYTGTWHQRSDGTIVGRRSSPDSGLSLEVIQGGASGLRNGYKVHKK